MRVRWLGGRALITLAAPVVAVALLTPGTGAAAALACPGWTVVKTPSPGTDGILNSVAVVSPRNVWAVGDYTSSSNGEATLVEHWNGIRWTQVASPNPEGLGGINFLEAIAAVSATDIWAVGGTGYASDLIIHWNGKKWTQVLGSAGELSGVAATSAKNAWAVGLSSTDGPLILHWNGTTWKQVPGPAATGLTAVTALSATDAWAVGCTLYDSCAVNGPPGQRTAVLHWNGQTWTQVSSASPAKGSNNDQLYGVAARSATDAWSVGDYTQGAGFQTLIEHRVGGSWKQVASPDPDAFYSVLAGTAVLSSTNAWAVGDTGGGLLITHWNGHAWSQSASPALSGGLTAVTAPSATDIWAVGYRQPGSPPAAQDTLALHRC
jgi:hypothetical protein